MNIAREYHTATLLQNGKILIAGGLGANNAEVGQAELYDPATGTFTATGNMVVPRASHTATLLTSGKVLIAGGPGAYQPPPEIYDPDSGAFTAAGTLVTQGFVPSFSVLLPDGTVLVTGGGTKYAELFDPTTGTFSETGGLQTGVDLWGAMTALGKGSAALALVTGGG